MAKISKEGTAPEPIDISGIPALANKLNEDNLPTPGNLYAKAAHLLTTAGQETTVNGLPARVTPQSREIKSNGELFYARVAMPIETTSESAGPLSIIFCAGKDFNDIQTPADYFSPLTFSTVTMQANLMSGDGETAVVNDPDSLLAARDILKDLTAQYGKDHRAALKAQQTAAASAEAQAERARSNAAQIERRKAAERKHKRHVAFGWLTAAAIAYAPQAIDYHDIDAKIGPVTMPYPVEFFVDVNNSSDHQAQGFPEPNGAIAVAPGLSHQTAPYLTKYDTTGAPDATFYDQGFGSPIRDESKPGLYESDFNFAINSKKDSDDFHDAIFDNGCYSISGNFTDGKTIVFTQTADLDKKVQLQFVNTSTIKVCKLPYTASDTTGSIFLYQTPDSK